MSDPAHERSRRQFSARADAYLTSPIHAKGADLDLMVELARQRRPALEGARLLDIATGAGHTALAFARVGARVTASDLTPAMLDTARALLKSELGDAPPEMVVAPAEALPFAAAAFEIVTCRIAAHHFVDPEAFVTESARVLVDGGLLLLVDNIAPHHTELATVMNRIERLRDPSHIEAYTVHRWVGWLAAVGLDLVHLSRFARVKDYRSWLERARTPAEVGAALEQEVLALPAPFRTYFRVVEQHGSLVSLGHETMLAAAVKVG